MGEVGAGIGRVEVVKLDCELSLRILRVLDDVEVKRLHLSLSTKLHNLDAGEHPSIGIESIIDGINISPKRTHTDNIIVALELTHQGRRHLDFLLSCVLHFGVRNEPSSSPNRGWDQAGIKTQAERGIP